MSENNNTNMALLCSPTGFLLNSFIWMLEKQKGRYIYGLRYNSDETLLRVSSSCSLNIFLKISCCVHLYYVYLFKVGYCQTLQIYSPILRKMQPLQTTENTF